MAPYHREMGKTMSRDGDIRGNERSYQRDRRDGGGWIPVLRYHRTHSGGKLKGKELVTLFVDNIPEEKDQQWLMSTFNKYGIVRDAFIPRKRSTRTGSKFGFVRFDCQVSAGMAVSKLNGVWVDNRRLFVKEATFGIEEEKNKQRASRLHVLRDQGPNGGVKPNHIMPKQGGNSNSGQSKWQGRSFAGVVRGETSKPLPALRQEITITAENVGSGWLYRSAVAIMKRVIPLSTLRNSFSLETDLVVQIRSMGGRSVLITFQSSEIRNSIINKPVMERWFERIKPWQGEPASLERFVWLSCQGIPLNAWNADTFKTIGEIWGVFIRTDDETLRDKSFAKGRILIAMEEISPIQRWVHLVVQGEIYDILIREESSSESPDGIEAGDEVVVQVSIEKKTSKNLEVASTEPTMEERVEEGDDDVESRVEETVNGEK